jgi:hypothetical protein
VNCGVFPFREGDAAYAFDEGILTEKVNGSAELAQLIYQNFKIFSARESVGLVAGLLFGLAGVRR